MLDIKIKTLIEMKNVFGFNKLDRHGKGKNLPQRISQQSSQAKKVKTQTKKKKFNNCGTNTKTVVYV